jgi:DNA-binding response OmpR family regulator
MRKDTSADIRPVARGAFGLFRLVPLQRRLERDREPLRIGGRAPDILIALATRPGEVISNRELLGIVWADVHVEEAACAFTSRLCAGRSATPTRRRPLWRMFRAAVTVSSRP